MSQDEFGIPREQWEQIEEEGDDALKAFVKTLRGKLSEQGQRIKKLEPLEARVAEMDAKEAKVTAAAALKEALGADPTDRQVAAYIRDEAPEAKAWVAEMGYPVQPAIAASEPAPGAQPAAASSTQPPAPSWQPTPQGAPPGPSKITKTELNKLAKTDWPTARQYLADGRVEGFEVPT